ncbi:hypothetical protein NEOC95_001551 [Neochlamydia sp. AcF95]|nr:hypothetical protein [Neochlamydia sp. AcF95]
MTNATSFFIMPSFQIGKKKNYLQRPPFFFSYLKEALFMIKA